MALIGAIRRVIPSASGSDNLGVRELDASRGGELYTYGFMQRRVAEGRGFLVNIGAFSTPIVGGGNGTVIDLDQPEGIINVEDGKAVMLLRAHVQAQAPLSATDNDESEILLAIDRTAKWAGDGTFTAETGLNMRTDNPRAYTGLIGSAFTADMLATTGADAVLGIELARSVTVADVQGTAATVVVTKHELVYEPAVSPIIVGPAAIYLYWGGTVATSGFAQVALLELDSSEIV